MNQGSNSYQEVICKRLFDKNMPYARFLSHNTKLGGRHMEHLKEAEQLPVKANNNRVIIIADTKASGYQAATYLLLKASGLQSVPLQDNQFEEDEDIFEDLLDECLEEYDGGDLTAEASYDENKDMIIENAEIWDSKADEYASQNPIQMQKRINSVQLIDNTVNLLLHCFRSEQEKESIMDEISDRVERFHNLFLLLPSDSVSEQFVERLVFEYDFSIVHAKEPSMKQLILIFQELATQAGLCLNSNTKVYDIIQSLKSYRGHIFWEKDMEKLIMNTAAKLQGRPANAEDFNLLYYNRKNLTGEMQLGAMIGQQEVKDQIMRTTAAAKLAQLQKEKYGENLAVYKHMAFAGAPGTGKTQIARITAQIFHEHGLSNGIFVEAGRNDLVAGYLGQTAIKIAKLFMKAKGGVIFIDEIGSLVQNDKDSYTKEAIIALVQYMENNPDTTVIFATYPNEMEQFLDSDRGLRSRVARVIEFQSYTNEELWEIFKLMAAKQHFTVAIEAKDRIIKFIEAYKKDKKEEFGNAREMRRLLQAAQEELAIRYFQTHQDETIEITLEDVSKAVEAILKKVPRRSSPFGFAYNPERSECIAVQ